MAVRGIVDTVSRHGPLDIGSPLVERFYNPVAAMPSIHFAYALIVAAALFLLARGGAVRVVALLYAPVCLLVIVATGNHYFVDAAAGAAAVVAAAVVVVALREISGYADSGRPAPAKRSTRHTRRDGP